MSLRPCGHRVFSYVRIFFFFSFVSFFFFRSEFFLPPSLKTAPRCYGRSSEALETSHDALSYCYFYASRAVWVSGRRRPIRLGATRLTSCRAVGFRFTCLVRARVCARCAGLLFRRVHGRATVNLFAIVRCAPRWPARRSHFSKRVPSFCTRHYTCAQSGEKTVRVIFLETHETFHDFQENGAVDTFFNNPAYQTYWTLSFTFYQQIRTRVS